MPTRDHAVLSSILVLVLAAVPPAQGIAGLAKVPVAEPVSLVVRAPGRWIERIVEEARAILPAKFEAEIDQGLRENTSEAGFATHHPDDWRRIGLDPDAVIAFSFSHPGGWLGLPQRTRATLPIHDATRLAEYLISEVESDAPSPAPTDWVGASRAFRRAGRHMVMVLRSDANDRELMADELNIAVGMQGGGETVSSTAVYRAVADQVSESAFAGLFIHPPRWSSAERTDEPATEVAAPIESALLAFAPRRISAAVRLGSESDLARHWQRGGDPTPALARLPPPAATIAISLADPLALLGSLRALISDLVDLPEQLPEFAEELGAELRGGAVGGALYPDPAGGIPHWVGFATIRDPDRVIAMLTDPAKTALGTLHVAEARDDARLWHAQELGLAIGITDRILYLGTAEAAIRTAIDGISTAYEPDLHAGALVEFDLGLRDALVSFAADAPPALLRGRLIGRVERANELLIGTAERVGGDFTWMAEAAAWAIWQSAQGR